MEKVSKRVISSITVSSIIFNLGLAEIISYAETIDVNKIHQLSKSDISDFEKDDITIKEKNSKKSLNTNEDRAAKLKVIDKDSINELINSSKSSVDNTTFKQVNKNISEFDLTDDGKYEYEVFEEEVTITGYFGSDTEIEIPSTIDGMPVTSIGDDAFAYCSSLSSIELPDSVTSIGDYAFAFCSLSSIELPNGLTSIGREAFYACSSLSSIKLPDSVTSIGDYAFAFCSLSSIELPDSVTSIGDAAFYGCSLSSIKLPNGLTSIGDYAFAYCSSLSSIELPDSVTSIGDAAFYGCSLSSIKLPNGLTSIGDYAFAFCSLSSIKLPNGLTSIGEGVFKGCRSLSSIEIPDSVTSIGEEAFYRCSSLRSIEIPDSVTSIGWGAFAYCSSLSSIKIPNSVTSIEDNAFDINSTIYVIKDSYAHNYALDKNLKYEFIITVENITLDKINLTLTNGDSYTLNATVSPEEATDKTVSWSSSNNEIVQVDENGNVKAVGKGSATITATTKDQGKTATCNIEVILPNKPVENITLDKTNLTLTKGDTYTLKATVSPEDVTDKTVSWSSSNNEIVQVDENGNVKAVGKGNATITATTKDQGKTATCNIKVVSQNTPSGGGGISTPTQPSITENKLVGENRYETAIKVSNEGWTKADNIIIVNSNAIVDALSATPFAKLKDAPILLTESDKLNSETKKEILRLKAKNIYIIGGESVVSDSVINELKAMNLTVERISGDDRYKTSLEIAKRLGNISEIAVVNGETGLPDAVSIAPVAAENTIPIVLASPNEGTKVFDEFIKNNNIKTSYVIGREKAISDEVESKLPNPQRLGGVNRNETNAIILEKFYTSKTLNNIFVAKDGMNKTDDLIDALAVGVLASKAKSPVVIVGKDLNSKQESLLSKKQPKEITQVGGNGNENAFSKIVNMFKK